MNKREQQKYDLLIKWGWSVNCMWMNECREPVKGWLHRYCLYVQTISIKLKYNEITQEVVQFD